MTSPPAVEVSRVGVSYGSRLALQDATATARPGELVCLVGMNGAGKSTLLKAIVGIVPHTGSVSVAGVAGRARRRLLAYVPQREEVEWAFPISVLEVVMLGRLEGLRRIGFASGQERAAARRALDAVGAADLWRRPIAELSGGQQQRVMLARALHNGASVLLLDEPLSGVDPTTREVVRGLLRRRCDEGGTVLMATHDVLGSAALADRVWGLNRTVVADVPAARLREREVLERIYGENLIVLPGGQLAVGDQAG